LGAGTAAELHQTLSLREPVPLTSAMPAVEV